MDESSRDSGSDLGLYRQAADIAYRYAKSRLDKKQTEDKLDKEETDVKEDIASLKGS